MSRHVLYNSLVDMPYASISDLRDDIRFSEAFFGRIVSVRIVRDVARGVDIRIDFSPLFDYFKEYEQ